MINGVDVIRIPAKDEYSYGLRLMEVFFTKKEISESLLFQSKKSNRKAFDPERVSQLFDFVDRRINSTSRYLKTRQIRSAETLVFKLTTGYYIS